MDNIEKEKAWLLEEKHNGHVSKSYNTDVKRLEAGEPIDYVIGHTPFLDCDIYLDGYPLIPRVETEHWVGKIISDIIKDSLQKETIPILDIFAGSGCIGVAILKHIKNSEVTFAEIDETLLLTIQKNIEKNELQDANSHICHSDVFTDVEGEFDYIFANPPYIDKDKKHTDTSVVNFEPHLALFADDGGMAYVERTFLEAVIHLRPRGVLLIEFDALEIDRIEELIDTHGGIYMNTEILKDQYGRPRVIKATRV